VQALSGSPDAWKIWLGWPRAVGPLRASIHLSALNNSCDRM
jgi:hypothetical protein